MDPEHLLYKLSSITAASSTMPAANSDSPVLTRLVAWNRDALLAMKVRSGTRTYHHERFISVFGTDRIRCFVISLAVTPLKAEQGWCIVCGNYLPIHLDDPGVQDGSDSDFQRHA